MYFFSYILKYADTVITAAAVVAGLNTIKFKPHCGEAGPRHHLATSYLLADSINHGWRLDLEPSLQYLYYCSQIGLGLCPLSNDALFIGLKKSPVGKFLRRGLNVSWRIFVVLISCFWLNY